MVSVQSSLLCGVDHPHIVVLLMLLQKMWGQRCARHLLNLLHVLGSCHMIIPSQELLGLLRCQSCRLEGVWTRPLSWHRLGTILDLRSCHRLLLGLGRIRRGKGLLSTLLDNLSSVIYRLLPMPKRLNELRIDLVVCHLSH